jgi:ribosomal protein S5
MAHVDPKCELSKSHPETWQSPVSHADSVGRTEADTIDALLPDLKQETLGIGFVQKQTDAGGISGFRALVAVGNSNLCLGVRRWHVQQRYLRKLG